MAPCTLEYEEDDLQRMLYQQIDQLAEWCQHVKTNPWRSAKKDISTNSGVPFNERLEQFLAYHQQQQQQQRDQHSINSIRPLWDDLYTMNMANKCRDLDFTEQVWQLCQMATDQEEIADTIYAILEQVRSGHIQPKV
jgi:hypothetical protein